MQKGFSLLEVLISLSITLIVGAAVFQLFQQNERVFHDQNLITEMHQGARAVISQSVEEIRMAGQGVPIYAETFGSSPSEETVAILNGSTSTRINFRAALSPSETYVSTPVPTILAAGSLVALTVDSATGLYNAVGGAPTNRFVYIWGSSDSSAWIWVRANINSIAPSTKSVGITVSSIGPVAAAGSSVRFPVSPTVSLEEAIALYYDSSMGTIRRTTASNMADPLHPLWAPANELAANVRLLRFDYFDLQGNPVEPDSLIHRASIARVDIHLVVQTAQELRNHSRSIYALSMRTMIRNAMIR